MENKIIRCLYRPFDQRYCYFSEVAMDYPDESLKFMSLKKITYVLILLDKQK